MGGCAMRDIKVREWECTICKSRKFLSSIKLAVVECDKCAGGKKMVEKKVLDETVREMP